jgi:hypothetical protein
MTRRNRVPSFVFANVKPPTMSFPSNSRSGQAAGSQSSLSDSIVALSCRPSASIKVAENMRARLTAAPSKKIQAIAPKAVEVAIVDATNRTPDII